MSQWVIDVLYVLAGVTLMPVALALAVIVLGAIGYLVMLGCIWVLSKADNW